MRIIDWSSDVCSSGLGVLELASVDDHRPYVLGQGPFDFHLRTESAAQQRPALVDTGVHRRVGGMQRLAPGKGQQAMCQLRPAQRGTQCGFDLLTERRASFGIVERSEEHTYELQSLMRISYAVF